MKDISYNPVPLRRWDYIYFSAIQLMTLGFIQSIGKPNNTAANSDYTRNIVSSSLAIGALACLWKAFTVGPREPQVEALTHKELLQLAQALGYPIDPVDDGVCHGFSYMWVQAILASDEETFYQRLRLISLYKNNFKLLIEDIAKARAKKGINLTSRDQELLELPAFFDGGFLYQKPDKYTDLFNQELIQKNTDLIYYYTQSAMLTNVTRSRLLNKCYIFNAKELENYLNDLSKILQNCPPSTPIVLSSSNHATSLRYCRDKQCWEYLDINDIQPNTCYQKLDTKGLVKHIRSFETEEYTLLNIKIYSTTPAEKINPYFETLDKKYSVKQEDIHRVNHQQESLLHMACVKDDLPTLKELIALKVNLNKANAQGKTPLQKACVHGNLEIVNELLKHGADPNQADHEGRTPLQKACVQGSIEIVNKLLKHGAAPNQADHEGRTPLQIAYTWNRPEVAEVLLQYGADLNQATSESGTLLYKACLQKNLEFVKVLLMHGADPNQTDNEGMTLLYSACLQKDLDLVKVLLMHGADPNQADDKGCWTLLHSACLQKDLDLVKVLLMHGADPTLADHEGVTPVQIAYIKKNLDLVNELRKHNVHLDPIDQEYITQLESDCRNENPALKELLANSQKDLIAEIPTCGNPKQEKNAKQFMHSLVNKVYMELKAINKTLQLKLKKIGDIIKNSLKTFKKTNPISTLLKWACNGILNLWSTIRTFIVGQLRKLGEKSESTRFFNHQTKTKETLAHLDETEEKITTLVNNELETLDESPQQGAGLV